MSATILKRLAIKKDIKRQALPNDKIITLENVESWTGKLKGYSDYESVSGDMVEYKKDDVLFNKLRPYLAKVHLAETAGVATGEMLVLTSNRKQLLPKYLFYKLISQDSINEVNNATYGVKMPRANWDIVGSIDFKLLPDINAQQVAVDILDHKTQTLDKMIAVKNHTRTYLSELRQGIITDAVLGRRDVAMSAAIKNAWVGAVPEHWNIVKLAHVAKVRTGGTPSRENLDYWTNGNIPWLASGEVNKGVITGVDSFITSLGMANSNATILPIDTVMVALNGQGKTKGMTALLKVPATCNQSLAGIVTDKNRLDPSYLYYYLNSKYSDIRGLKGEARDGLNLDIIGTIPIPLPPVDKQLEIVRKIGSRISKLDTAEIKLRDSIRLLEEYRSSLISNVVDGKVEA